MAKYPSDESAARTEALVREPEAQTDRGVAIVGVAWVEEALTAAIESFLVKDKTAWTRLFHKSGPLSSLASKIDLSRLLDMTSRPSLQTFTSSVKCATSLRTQSWTETTLPSPSRRRTSRIGAWPCALWHMRSIGIQRPHSFVLALY